MEFKFYFGPEKIPFFVQPEGRLKPQEQMPFHGIVSRGVLDSMIAGKLGYENWLHVAPCVEHETTLSGNSDATTLSQLIRGCKMLTFGQSAICARRYIEEHCRDVLNSDSGCCEIWHLKEGHISSVWKIQIDGNDSPGYHFILNIARDDKAGQQLKQSSEKIQQISLQLPHIHLARVYDIQMVTTSYEGGYHEVLVSKNQLIKDALEIHYLAKGRNARQYILIERFLPCSGNPARVQSVYGRQCSREEGRRIEDDIGGFVKQTAHYNTSVNINNGDAVWDGNNAIIVAISD